MRCQRFITYENSIPQARILERREQICRIGIFFAEIASHNLATTCRQQKHLALMEFGAKVPRA